MTPPNPELRRGTSPRTALTALVVVITATLAACGGEPPIDITVEGTPRSLPGGITLGAAIAELDLLAPRGDLLDVQGQVLRPNVYGGRVLLNGSPAPLQRLLRSGDTITMERGSDRVEETVRNATRISAGRPGNPQFSLGISGGRQILVRGAISGKVVKAEFQPTGPYRQPKAVALTFDDGPSARYTPRILAILQKYDVQATFFMVGIHVQQYPAVVRMVAEAGMTIGNHSFSHPNSPPFRQLPRSRINDEIHRTADALSSLGIASGLFRPPGGSFSPAVIRIAATVDARLVLWTVDPHDWGGRNPRDIVRAVLGAVKPGSIIALHDGGGDRSATVRALPRIIEGIQARGLELVAIPP